MAVFTLTADSNYSAIKGSLDNGDTIRCDTFRLTVDEQPALTNITVDSPGTAGRMTVSGAYDLSTWSIIAGTVNLIDGTFPAGATLGSSTGGQSNASGINVNNGTVLQAIGGTENAAHGVSGNSGTVETAIGGSNFNTLGVRFNDGLIITATAGSLVINGNHGVQVNRGTVTTAIGGSLSASGSQQGVIDNHGTVLNAIGGSGSSGFGVGNNVGIVFAASDNTGFGVNFSYTAIKVVDGPNYRSRIINLPTSGRLVTTVYSIGSLSSSAVVGAGITVIEVNPASSFSKKLSLRGGFRN